MGVFDRRIPSPQLGTMGVVDEITFHSKLVITTGGALAATTAANPTWLPAGQLATKNAAAGRYDYVLPCNFKRLLQVIATPIGADAAAYGAAGVTAIVRDNDVGFGANDGTLTVQFVTGAGADTNVPDAAEILVTIIVAQGMVS